MKAQFSDTVDSAEIERFTQMADEWWDEGGKFKPLHQITPLRIGLIRDLAAPLSGKTLLDIGCGGGLVCEPMQRLGAQITGIDAGEKNIRVAQLHAERSGLEIDYCCTTAENLANSEPRPQYDVVLALEIIEHVADVGAFTAAACALVKPGGLLVMSTLNRTVKSYAMAILGAEYVLRWLPVGTHNWKKFLKPHELAEQLRANGFSNPEMTGMVYNPLTRTWRLERSDLSVNYLLWARKPG